MTWEQLVISIASLVGTTAMTSYLTDHIQRQLDYRKLKSKLDNFAGLQAVVLFGDTKYRIQSIDRHGIVMQNELQTIFVPIKKALDNVIALPSDSYDTATIKSAAGPQPVADQQMSQMMEDMLAQRFSMLMARAREDFTADYNPAEPDDTKEMAAARAKATASNRTQGRPGQNSQQLPSKRRQPPRPHTSFGG